MPFQPGRLIVHRNVRRGRIAWVRPARVVSDDERGLLLWIARDSVVANEVADDGRTLRAMPFTEWVTGTPRLTIGRWDGPGMLLLTPVTGSNSVWWFFDEDGRWANWYVNLEASGVRWDDGQLAGIDVVDHDLDIVVEPDRSWRWKDEDEFAERLAIPEHYWVDEPEAVWVEGRRMVKLIEAGEFPFDGTWCDYSPPADWVAPVELPDGWDRPAAR